MWRHAYARRRDGSPWVLFAHVADPDQRRNLAGVPGSEPLQAALEKELQGWLDRTGDRFAGGTEILRDLGLVTLWNARERELRGDRARLLEETT